MNTNSTVVIAATEPELSWLTGRLQARPERPLLDYPVSHAADGPAGIRLIISGPGMANAAAACAAAIERFKPARIFNTGICGLYARDRALLGTAVIGEQAIFADTGAQSDTAFTSLSEMGLPVAQPPAGSVFNAIELDSLGLPQGLLRADFLTVASVSGSPEYAKKISGRFQHRSGVLLCEDMESAAVALAALRSGIPCTVVRGISNLCGERDHARWEISAAARSAQETLYTLLRP
jgi:futalosine hydrolase